MAEDKKGFTIKEGVMVTDDVVAGIAGLAATETEGVHSLAGNLTHEMVSKAGGNRLQKAVKIGTDATGELLVTISMIMDYGYEIPKVCKMAQEKVKNSIENMTGLTVGNVDIRVANVAVGTNA